MDTSWSIFAMENFVGIIVKYWRIWIKLKYVTQVDSNKTRDESRAHTYGIHVTLLLASRIF